MKKLNLRVGEPSFYEEYWKMSGPGEKLVKPMAHYEYPLDNKGLIKSIIELHSTIHGQNYRPEHIVLGNGASQMISAAVFAHDIDTIHVPKPYWVRIPELCKMGGYHKNLQVSDDSPNLFLVSPNNPCGKEATVGETVHAKVVDFCYNWPQYTNFGKVNTATPDIAIYSLSKAMGLAGVRLGWAITRDSRLAERMRHYVEYSSAGVSVFNQSEGANHIRHVLSGLDTPHDLFQWANEKLLSRWLALEEALDGSHIEVENKGKGMFAWLYAPSVSDLSLLLEEEYGIMSMSGSESGVSPSYARLNVGCNETDFNELIKRIKNAKASQTRGRRVPAV